jgi:CRP-like cAMP-binding protein
MATTLRDLGGMAAGFTRAGEWLKALKVSLRILEYSPYDFENRMRVADLLLALGERAAAREVYKAVAWSAIRGGQPLLGVVACKQVLANLPPGSPAREPQVEELLGALASLYGSQSQRTSKGGARVSVDWEKDVPGIDPYEDVPLAVLLPAVTKLALDTSQLTTYPQLLPRLPILSDLSGEAFRRILEGLVLHRLHDGQAALREGEPGSSFFILARGRMRVFNTDTLGRQTDLAHLTEPAIFGEMAILSAAPRAASVVAEGDSDLLECTGAALAAAANELPTVAQALDGFARERLVGNLLTTSPIFRPFQRPQRLELMRHFSAHDVATGTQIVRQGDEGRGLYVVLKGEVDVVRDEGAKRVPLATLRTGEVFGEISLLQHQPTNASVTASAPTTILFLAREYFQRIVSAVPALAEYFQGLSEERLLDTRMAVEGAELDEDESLDIDLHVLV